MASVTDFRESVEFVLAREGGYVNDPADPGGETNYGISKRSYPHLDIRRLTREQAIAIYERDYWRASGASALPMPLALVVFDTAVNQGNALAKQLLMQSGGDVNRYLTLRRDAYARIVARRPASQKFLAGWLARVEHLASRIGPAGGAAVGGAALLLLLLFLRGSR